MHTIYQHFSELIEQAVIQLCPNLFLNFPAVAELQVRDFFDVSYLVLNLINRCLYLGVKNYGNINDVKFLLCKIYNFPSTVVIRFTHQ